MNILDTSIFFIIMALILYKNSSHLGWYVDCECKVLNFNANVQKDILNEEYFDCLAPFAADSSVSFVKCKAFIISCDTLDFDELPEILISTERGVWNLLHANSVYMLPRKNFTLQICTRDKTTCSKRPFQIQFKDLHSNTYAISENIIILSKPPSSQSLPFARIQHDVAENDKVNRKSPQKWICKFLNESNLTLEALAPSKSPKPMKFISLGTYRLHFVSTELPEKSCVESSLREELRIERLKLSEAREQINGLTRALKLLSGRSEKEMTD